MPDETEFAPRPLSCFKHHNLICLLVWVGCFLAAVWVFKSGAFVAWDWHVNFGPNPGGLGWLASLFWGFVSATFAFGILYAQAMSTFSNWQLKRYRKDTE